MMQSFNASPPRTGVYTPPSSQPSYAQPIPPPPPSIQQGMISGNTSPLQQRSQHQLGFPEAKIDIPDRRLIRGRKYPLKLLLPLSLNIPVADVFMAGLHPNCMPHNVAAPVRPGSKDVPKLICHKCGDLLRVETQGFTNQPETGYRVYHFQIRSLCSSSQKHLGCQVFLSIDLPGYGLVYSKPLSLVAKESRKVTPGSPAGSAGEDSTPPVFPPALNDSSTGSQPIMTPESMDVSGTVVPEVQQVESPGYYSTPGNVTLPSSPAPAHNPFRAQYTVIRSFHFACPSKGGQPGMSSETVRDMLLQFYEREVPGLQSHIVHMPLADGVFISISSYQSAAAAEASHSYFLLWTQHLQGMGAHLNPLGSYSSWY